MIWIFVLVALFAIVMTVVTAPLHDPNRGFGVANSVPKPEPLDSDVAMKLMVPDDYDS